MNAEGLNGSHLLAELGPGKPGVMTPQMTVRLPEERAEEAEAVARVSVPMSHADRH